MNQSAMADKILDVLREHRDTSSGTTFSSHAMREILKDAGCSAATEERDYTTVLADLKDRGLIEVTGAFPLQLRLR